MEQKVDIKENYIYELDNKLLEILIKDRSSNKNIIWATDNYAIRGKGYYPRDHIALKSITGRNGLVIKPRVKKSKKEQSKRIKDKAEVFTPSWICNAQNNLIDEAWFGRKNVFNIENQEQKSWQVIKEKIVFPENKTWQDYVKENRLEISCGEAPYLASRYDTVSGEWLEPNNRIGLLDRKLRIVNENVDNEKEWHDWTIKAYKSIYGFEWQGDSLLTEKNLDDAISVELNYFPIITTNANKLVKVTPTNIVEIIANYNKNLSILEASEKVDFDESMLNNENIKEFLKSQSSKGISSNMKGNMHDGETKDPDVDDSIDNTNNNDDNNSTSNNTQNLINYNELGKDEKKDYLKRYRNSIAKLMFYSFLTKSNINTLQELYNSVFEENEEIENNKRIFDNLKLKEEFVADHIKCCKGDYALEIDNAVAQANLLSRDSSLSEEKRVENALARFNRISESEVVTPQNICKEMYETIGQDKLCEIVTNNGKILDIASKTGEFAVSLYYMLKDKVDNEKLKKSIYSIPTSKMTYEFTRKIYEILGMPLENIAAEFNSYRLLDIKLENSNKIDYDKVVKIITQDKNFNIITIDDNIEEGGKKVKFDAVVGNPPYQENISKSEGNKSLSKQLFPTFIKLSTKISSLTSLITPSRWFASEGQDGSFISLREWAKKNNHFKIIVNIHSGKQVFNGIEISGVNYFLYDKKYTGHVSFIDYTSKLKMERSLFEKGIDIILPMNEMVSILNKVVNKDFISLMEITKGRNAFNVVGKQSEVIKNTKETKFKDSVEVRCAYEVIRYIDKKNITKNIDMIDKWKVFTSKGNGGAGLLGDDKPVAILGKSYIGYPNSICTDSLIPIGSFDNECEAINLQKYLCLKFTRFMIGILKVSQNLYQNVYKFVPMQNFTNNSDINWSKPISEIDQQLYEKYNLTEEEINFIESKIKPME